MNLKSFLFLSAIVPTIFASCSTGNMNTAADAQIQPSEEKLPDLDPANDQQALGLGSKKTITCEKTCGGKTYSLGGCMDFGKGTRDSLHCNGKTIEQWFGDCTLKMGVYCRGFLIWKIN